MKPIGSTLEELDKEVKKEVPPAAKLVAEKIVDLRARLEGVAKREDYASAIGLKGAIFQVEVLYEELLRENL